jgi:hypothetical protein
MRRVVGTIMVVGGILIAPPLWDEISGGGLRPKLVFSGALAVITTGLVLSCASRRGNEGNGGPV